MHRTHDADSNRPLLALVAIAAALHVGTAAGVDRFTRGLQRAMPTLSVRSEFDLEAPHVATRPETRVEPSRSPTSSPDTIPVHREPLSRARATQTRATASAPSPVAAAPLITMPDTYANDPNADRVATANNANATGPTTNSGPSGPHGGNGLVPNGRGDDRTGQTAETPTHDPATVAADYSSHAEFGCDESAAREQFPDAAREAGITEMDVNLRVTVDASARVIAIEPSRDPGFGFVAAAIQVIRRNCSIRSARDRNGAAIAETRRIAIRFVLE